MKRLPAWVKQNMILLAMFRGEKMDLGELICQRVIHEVEEQNTRKFVCRDFFTFLKVPSIGG
jgi:hypothetical protein